MQPAQEIEASAARLNRRELTIEALRDRALDSAEKMMALVILQGQELKCLKAAVPVGEWLAWLGEHCPKISERMAQRYMRLASDPTRVSECSSLRQALALLQERGGDIDRPAKQAKAWPAYVEAIGFADKMLYVLNQVPIDQWPEESVTKLRSELEPLASLLWPAKFQL